MPLGEINPPVETVPNPRTTVSFNSLRVSPVTVSVTGTVAPSATLPIDTSVGDVNVKSSPAAVPPVRTTCTVAPAGTAGPVVAASPLVSTTRLTIAGAEPVSPSATALEASSKPTLKLLSVMFAVTDGPDRLL